MVSDERLVENIRAGDMSAFDELYARYETRLFCFIFRYLGNRQDAEEVFHEAVLTLLRPGGPDFREGGFRSWIYTVARNLSLNRLRSSRREGVALERLADEPRPEPLEEELELAAAAEQLSVAVGRLPLALSEVYSLRAAGMPYEEIARVLEIPVGTVRSRIHEMVKRLKKELRTWTVN